MNSRINPSVLHAKVRDMEASKQKSISKLLSKPTLKLKKQKWTKPYNRTFLVIEWKIKSEPGEYDYVAVFDKDPMSPFEFIPYQYYWVNRNKSKTIVTDIVYKENCEYFVAYYTYLRDRSEENYCDFTPMEIIVVKEDIAELPPEDDGLVYTSQPHPRIYPQDVNLEQTKEALTADMSTGSYIVHNPYLTVSGQNTLDIGNDLNLTYDLNWYHSNKVSMWDYVAIFDRYPEDAEGFIANQWCWCVNHDSGFCTTNVKFDRSHDYYIAYIIYDFVEKRYIVKEVSKYQIHSHWMGDLKDTIYGLKLKDVMIPGSHDSACYNMTMPVADSWTQTQSETFANQLHDGIRYFDLRVEYFAKYEDKFWFTHNKWSTENSVASFLKLIKEFISNSQEIVLLDFSHFYYFDNANIHDELIDIIIDTIGDYMASNTLTQNVTVGKLLDSNKRVIVAYDDKSQSEKYKADDRLWPVIQSDWPDVDKVDDAKTTLDKEVKKKHTGFWVLQGILTPLAESDFPYSIQHLANKINPNLDKWMESYWLHNTINIVISDFYLGNNITSIAMERNLARGRAAQYSAIN